MATRTSLYLSGGMEEELKSRAQQRFGSEDGVSLGHIITRNLSLYFGACKNTRAKLAETFTYEEMRFLCSAVSSSDILEDIDDLEQYQQFAADVHLYWMDKKDDGAKSGGLPRKDADFAQEGDPDWIYYERVDPQALEEKVKALPLFEVIALVDGIRTAFSVEHPERELLRLFRGLRRPT